MKYYLLLIVVLWHFNLIAQTITGRVMDEAVSGLSYHDVKLYIKPNIFTTVTDANGYFVINLTEVKEETLPKGYIISNNYPNPFNPKTRIDFTLPEAGKIKVEIYNTIGQNVGSNIEKEMQAGHNSLDLELNGLPNGVYFARINVNDKYNVVRKLMLLYGSQHLLTNVQSEGQNYSKPLTLTHIDSVVVSAGSIRTRTFPNLPELMGSQLSLGDLRIPIACPGLSYVAYSGKNYRTIQLGTQCWLRANLDVGTMIQNTVPQSNNGQIEKYCYDNILANCTTYGGLYNLEEVLNYTPDVIEKRGICPEGWRIPNQADMEKLAATVQNNSSYLISETVSGGINKSSFSALLAGVIQNNEFHSLNVSTVFWMWTGNALGLTNVNQDISVLDVNGLGSYSVRCIKGERPGMQTIIYPPQNATFVPLEPIVKWKKDIKASSYWLQLSTNSSFTNLLLDKHGIVDVFFTIGPLAYTKYYYLRIRGESESGYSNEWSYVSNFKTVNPPTIGVPCPGMETVVYEGKIYHTVKLGNTCWFKENLDVGDMIPSLQNQTNNTIIEKYCYNDVAANCAEYGGLYTFKEALKFNTTQNQGICPAGWHIPSTTNIDEIVSCANNKFSSILAIGSNETGFSAKMGGYFYDDSFVGMGSETNIWSSYNWIEPDHGHTLTCYLKIDTAASTTYRENMYKTVHSVRCVK